MNALVLTVDIAVVGGVISVSVIVLVREQAS